MPKQLSSTEYTAFSKRLQSALKRRDIVVTLPSIKESIAELVDSYDNELNEQVQQICLDALLQKYQSNGVVVSGEGQDLEQQITAALSLESSELGITPRNEEEKREIVTSKAAQMNIQLSVDDVAYVASQIDTQVDTTLEDVLAQTENLLCAYANYKKQQGLQKIDAMFGRVYDHAQQNNEDTSKHISQGLRRFGQDIERSQLDFKSSVLNALECLKIPIS